MLPNRHRSALAALIGEDAVLDMPGDCARYETGARGERGKAALVLRPADTRAVSACVAYCVQNALPIVPQSGNTGLVAASTPDASGDQIVLSLERLSGIFEIDADNRSARVGAGVRLSDLNRRVEDQGLFFPIDLGADPCVGGMVATNTGGARFIRHGDMRRNVIGLTVVLADASGTVLDLASQSRKNNVGPDWKQLFIGTSGAFGIVTECVLNLERRPRQTCTAYLVAQSGEAVQRLLALLEERAGLYLSAFEGMSGKAIRAALAHVPSLRNPFPAGAIPAFAILIELSRTWHARPGEQSLDAFMETLLAEIWSEPESPLADAFLGPDNEMWALRHALSDGVRHAGRVVAFDLGFRRGVVLPFRERVQAEIGGKFPGVCIADFGHVGDGGVHLNLVVDHNVPEAADFERRLRDLVYGIAVDDFGGSFSAEHGIGPKNQYFYDRTTQHRTRQLAAGMKQLTSPGNLGNVRFD